MELVLIVVFILILLSYGKIKYFIICRLSNKNKIILHNRKVKNVKDDLEQVKKLREELENDLKLSKRFYQILTEIKSYSHRNESCSSYWPVESIRPSQITANSSLNKILKNLINEWDYTDELLNLEFTVNQIKYNLLFTGLQNHQCDTDLFEFNYSYTMVVLESETKIAFCSEVYIGLNEYGETYSFSILKSFRPNTWTVYILDLIDKVLFEANHFRQKETEKENQEDIKNNYL